MNIEYKICATLDEFNTLRDSGEIQDSWVVLIEDQPALWTNGKLLPCPYTKEQLESLFVTIASKGIANGIASLNENGKIPESQLPSYVDDVLEFENSASFPIVGESGKIYIALNTNLTYRWSGSAYVQISPSIALGYNSSTAYPGSEGSRLNDHIYSLGSKSSFPNGLLFNISNFNPIADSYGQFAMRFRTYDSIYRGWNSNYEDIKYFNISTANKTDCGLMSAADKVKLDSIPTTTGFTSMQVVPALPADPDPNTLYIVTA